MILLFLAKEDVASSSPVTRCRPSLPNRLQRGRPRFRNCDRCVLFRRAKASRRSPLGEGGQAPIMHYVYILESLSVPGHYYIGSTDNLRQRVRQHQADVDAHAAKYRPWKLKTYLAFEQKVTSVRFETYLKSGSGRAFCRRHFD